MVTIKVLLKTAQPKKNGTYPVLIRITSDRITRFVSTGYFVKKGQFAEQATENWIHRHPDAQLMNAGIEKKRSTIAEQVYKADIAGAELDVNKILKPAKGGRTFLNLLEAQKTTFEKRNQAGSYSKTATRIKNLRAAWDGGDVPISELNKSWVDKYINDRYSKGASPNTIRKDLSFFSGALQNLESFTGRNYFKSAQKTIAKVPIKKEKLTMEEIKLLENAILFNLESVARDMFLFSYYTQGMRFGDVAMIERNVIKRLQIDYRMSKSKKLREIEIHPKLQAIIDRYLKAKTPYLFPILKKKIKDDWQKKKEMDVANALINNRLKRVAVICGIEKNLSMHIAKHTFSSLSLKRGVPVEILKEALGHSSYQTTQMYLDELSNESVNKAVRGLYD